MSTTATRPATSAVATATATATASCCGIGVVCDLTPVVGLSQPTVSHHLKVLVEAGLLEREKRGTWAWFRLVPARLDDVTAIFR